VSVPLFKGPVLISCSRLKDRSTSACDLRARAALNITLQEASPLTARDGFASSGLSSKPACGPQSPSTFENVFTVCLAKRGHRTPTMGTRQHERGGALGALPDDFAVAKAAQKLISSPDTIRLLPLQQ
jgi:hypothetical protein